MQRKFLKALIGFLLFSSTDLFSQSTFVKSLGENNTKEEAYSVNPMNSGVVIGGYKENPNGTKRDAFIIALDGNGNKIWSKTYDLGKKETIYCVKQRRDGGFIAVGSISDDASTPIIASRSVLAISLKSDGTLEWAKVYDSSNVDDIGQRVIEINPNHFIISGRCAINGGLSYGITIDINKSGTVLAYKYTKYKSANSVNTYFGDVIQDGSNYVISGFASYNSSADNDPIAIKFSPSSNKYISSATVTSAVKYNGGSGFNQGSYAITNNSSGGFFTAGNYWNQSNTNELCVSFMNLNNDLSMGKYAIYKDKNTSRNKIRSNIIKQATENNLSYYISPLSDESGGGRRKAGLALVNEDCSIKWSHFYDFTNKDAYSSDACQTKDGGYIVVGYTDKFSLTSNEGNILVIKTDKDGNVNPSGADCFTKQDDVLLSVTNTFTSNEFTTEASTGMNLPSIQSSVKDYVSKDSSCFTTSYCGCTNTVNLITNGGFENGATGFTSKFTQMTTSLAPGTYTVAEYGSYKNFCSNWNVSNPASCPRGGAMQGKFLVANGQTGQTGFRTVWGQTMTVETGKDYKLCLNLKNLPQCCFDVKPVIRIMYNYGSQSNFIGPIIVNQANTACDWLKYTTTISIPPGGSPTTLLSINIDLDQSGLGDGNDFAIDDMSLIKLDKLPAGSLRIAPNDVSTTFINNTDYTMNVPVTANPPLPAGSGIWWRVVELDPNNNEIPGTMVESPNSSWWNIPCNFPGYNGTSTVSGTSPGVFKTHKTYKIYFGTWGDCFSWTSTNFIISINPSSRKAIITQDNKPISRPKNIQ